MGGGFRDGRRTATGKQAGSAVLRAGRSAAVATAPTDRELLADFGGGALPDRRRPGEVHLRGSGPRLPIVASRWGARRRVTDRRRGADFEVPTVTLARRWRRAIAFSHRSSAPLPPRQHG